MRAGAGKTSKFRIETVSACTVFWIHQPISRTSWNHLCWHCGSCETRKLVWTCPVWPSICSTPSWLLLRSATHFQQCKSWASGHGGIYAELCWMAPSADPTQKKKKKTLTGSYAGQNNLLATPLLQWYLSQGLEALDIQQVVEYSALSGAFNSLEKQCLMLVGKETEILPKLVWQVPSHCWGTLLMERPLPTLPGIPMCCTPMRKGPKHWSMTLFESSPHWRKMYTRRKWQSLSSDGTCPCK